nr:ribonuclease HII [Methylobacterium oryzihabitans]
MREAGMPPFDPRLAHTYPAVIGCDEVGRGALCGPVIVAAVYFDPRRIPADLLGALDDSKRLDAATRERLAPAIAAAGAVAYAGGSRELIDRINVRAATLDAMRRAVARVAAAGIAATVMVDGRDVPPGLTLPAEARVGGDRLVPQIAAASIVAKVMRDRLMRALARRHPAYAWERNVGYGTAAHRAAMLSAGISRHHRTSFRSGAVSLRGGAKPVP